MFQTLGIMLLLGCTVALIFTVIFWFLLPLTLAEGILASAFFTSLLTIGYFMFKLDYQTEPCEIEP